MTTANSPEFGKQQLINSLEKEQQLVEISRVIKLSNQLLKNPSTEIVLGVVPIQTNLLQLQKSGVNYVNRAVEIMLESLGERPSLSLSEITRVLTESNTAANDEKYSLAA